MKQLFNRFAWALCVAAFPLNLLVAQNQTDTLSPVLPQTDLPFTLQIETASFSLPSGIQAFASAIYKGKWIFITGRTNGMHTFNNVGNNFPPTAQNAVVYVVDPATGTSSSRSLLAIEGSGLSQSQVDDLSVTAAQFFQKENTLYVVGGYGINTATEEMETKSTLTAIDLKKMIDLVTTGKSTAAKAIRQVSHPLLQVTGGFLFQANSHTPFLLMLGQNFTGLYRDDSNGAYTNQIRKFWVQDDGKNLRITADESSKMLADYRRRDLNIVPILQNNKFAYVAFAGVFTLDDGVWTVPITVYPDGSSFEPNPQSPDTFKQAMNQYNCAAFGLYSTRSKDMFVVFPGGLSYGYFSGAVFTTDPEIPFINQVTTIKIDQNNNFTQHLMDGEYPVIPSTGTNPGNPLLFGTEAQFFPAKGIALYSNGVIQLDKLPSEPIVIGYIAGGIMSTLANTNTGADSTSSPYVFTVKLIPK